MCGPEFERSWDCAASNVKRNATAAMEFEVRVRTAPDDFRKGWERREFGDRVGLHDSVPEL
jgi:hypothetical protein